MPYYYWISSKFPLYKLIHLDKTKTYTSDSLHPNISMHILYTVL